MMSKKKLETALQVYVNDAFGKIRAVLIDGKPYFVGKDVATALGYQKPRNALATHVDEEDALKWGAPTKGGVQLMTLINESGLYSLILSSKLESAKAFKRWVTSEVLPSIRETGTYGDKGYQKWLETRKHGKISRRQETDAIKLFIEYAHAQGSTWKESRFYGIISVWCNKSVGLPAKGGRDSATVHQLNTLDLLEGTMVKNVLINGMTENQHWTRIIAKVLQQLNSLLEILFQTQKFQIT